MRKGKGKARVSPKGATRKIAPMRTSITKVKPSRASVIEVGSGAAGGGSGGGVAAVVAAAGSSKKSSSSRKPRPSDKNDSNSSTGGGAQSHVSSGADTETPSPYDDLYMLKCTCPHLAEHPDRVELLRKLVDIRIEVKMGAAAAKQGIGAKTGQGKGYYASQCSTCEEHTLDEGDNVLICLGCGYTGCTNPPKRHMMRHCLLKPGTNHSFAVSRSRAELFCASCCDFVYDAEFDAAICRTDEKLGIPARNESLGGVGAELDDESLRGKRRRRVRDDGHYLITDRYGQQPWREQAWPPPVLLSPANARLVAAGVRGMFNLGNTCFMSSVLQAVLHISVMKSFFFGKGHDPTRCEKLRKETSKLRSQILQYDASTSLDVPAGDSSRSGRSAGVKKLGDYCIACELSKLFQDMFSTDAVEATMDDAEPYVPHRLLEAVWGASAALAGYEQQDAHEFLIAILDSLHGHLDRTAANEMSIPGLRRTLAALKQQAKQQQGEAKPEEPPPEKSVRKLIKGALSKGSKGSGGGGGASEARLPRSPKSPLSGKGGDCDGSGGSRSRKRNRKAVDDDGDDLGWESPQRVTKSAGGSEHGTKLVGMRSNKSSKSHHQTSPSSAERAAVRRNLGGTPKSAMHQNGRYQATPNDESPASPSQSADRSCRGASSSSRASVTCAMPQKARCPAAPRASPEVGHKFSASSPSRRVGSDAANVLGADVGATAKMSNGYRTSEGCGGGSAINGQRLEDLNLRGFVQEVFAGVTRSDVVCTKCDHVSCTYERFLEVSLPIRPGEHEPVHKRRSKSTADSRRSPSRGGANARSGGGTSGTSRGSSISPTSSSSASGLSGVGGGAAGNSTTRQRKTGRGQNRVQEGLGMPPSSRSAGAVAGGRSLVDSNIARVSTASSSLSSSLPLLSPPLGRLSPSSSMSDDSGPSSTTGTARTGSENGRQSTATSSSPDNGQLGQEDLEESKDEAEEPEEVVRSIRDCFTRFAAKEDLTAPMRCDSCATSVRKTKQMSFCSLPRVLVLHLKRFDAMADKKINDFVSFPARGLDMRQYYSGWSANGGFAGDAGASTTDPCTPSLLYDLVAVVNHSGSMAQGHYTAFVRELGRWFRFDDTWVREVEEEEVLASEAYLLFYSQRGADTSWRQSSSSLSDCDSLNVPSSLPSFTSPGAPQFPTASTKRRRS